MKCNLVKKVVKFTDKEGKEKTARNYSLVFENGIRVDIVPKYFEWEKVEDKTKRDQLINTNVRNATRLDSLADLDEDEYSEF